MSSSWPSVKLSSPPPPGPLVTSRRGARFWISAWLPVAIGISVIVIESTVWFGADHTPGPLRAIFEAIFGPVSNARWEPIHHYIRKSGHFVGYGMLGLMWLRAWWLTLALRASCLGNAPYWRSQAPPWWPVATSGIRPFCRTEPALRGTCCLIAAERPSRSCSSTRTRAHSERKG